MKLIISRENIIKNIKRAEQISGSASVSLVFKDFYSYLYQERLNNYVCFGNEVSTRYRVTNNIVNSEKSFGKVLIYEKDIKKHIETSQRIYLPLNMKDDREGLSLKKIDHILDTFSSKKDKFYLMITSGCSNENAPTTQELYQIWDKMKNKIKGISIGGSYYLSREIPDFISEIRIGEFMVLGSIPYNKQLKNLGENALVFESEVLAVYPERKQILVNGGYAVINTKESKVLSDRLFFSSMSSDYTIYNDEENKYKKGDKVQVQPSYQSLVTLQNINREYI